MIHLKCAGCGEPVEVESLIAAGSQPCPHCGRLIIGGGTPRPAGAPDAPVGYGMETQARERYRPRSGSQSIGVTLLGIANIFFAGMLALCCALPAFFAPQIMQMAVQSPEGNRALRDKGYTPEMIAQIPQYSNYLYLAAGVLIALSVLVGFTGVGLLARKQWARVMTLGFGGLAGVLALVGASQGELCSFAFYGGYSLAAFVILLGSGDEFSRSTA